MALVQLEDCLKLDIPEIDSQHEMLISQINRIHEAMLQGTDKAVLDLLLSQLLEHTRAHFSYEEGLMTRYSYPAYETHRSDHLRLMRHLRDLVDRYHQGDLLLSFAVILELKGWALVHIEKSDKPLGAFLVNRERINQAPV